MENTIIDNQSKCLRLIEHEKSLFFFNGIQYEEPSLEELKNIKKLIESNIKNYDSVSSNIKYYNECIYEDLFPTIKRKYINEPKKTISGIIYILKCERTKLYKIGLTSTKIDSRLKSLKTANPSISLVKYYSGITDIYSEEKKLHNLFADKRIDGEWFELDDSDLNTIDWFFNIPF